MRAYILRQFERGGVALLRRVDRRVVVARGATLNETHFQYARSMLKSFAAVAPLSEMKSMGGRMQARLNWSVLDAPRANTHRQNDKYDAVYARISTMVATHNRWDLRLYDEVQSLYGGHAVA